MNGRRRAFGGVTVVLLIAAGAILPVVATEIGMRAYHAYVKHHSPYAPAADPRLVFVRKPNAYREINSLGFRDQEFYPEKRENAFRIVVLGDSITSGYGVQFEQMYTERLETALNGRDRRYEVLNLGIEQYSTLQEVALLELMGIDLSPDLVILAYVLNDPTSDGSLNNFFRRDRKISVALDWIAERSRGLFDLGEPFRPAQGCHYFDYYSQMHCDAAKWTGVRRAFSRLRKLARANGFEVLLVLFPLLENGDDVSFDRYPWALFHRRIMQEGQLHGFETLDLLPHFARRAPAELKVSADDRLHPNALGHQIAAAAIHRQLMGSSHGGP